MVDEVDQHCEVDAGDYGDVGKLSHLQGCCLETAAVGKVYKNNRRPRTYGLGNSLLQRRSTAFFVGDGSKRSVIPGDISYGPNKTGSEITVRHDDPLNLFTHSPRKGTRGVSSER